MALKLGANSINKLYLGSTAINKAYLGATVVFSGGGAVYFVETYGEQSLFDLSDALDPIINETYPEIMENY